MANYLWNLLAALTFLAVLWRAHGQSDDDFNLEDAIDFDPTEKPKPKTPKPPTRNTGGGADIDLLDYFDTPVKPTTKPRKPVTKTTPKKPDSGDLDLSDALDPNNDRKNNGGGSKDRDKIPSGGKQSDISDADLEDLDNAGYKPDKNKGSGGRGGAGGRSDDSDSSYGNQAETGTIAGIVSALAMALVGAVTSYISYQQKKFCFSIQEGLNAEYVKGEHMEGVVTEEPPVKYSSLETSAAAPPAEDPSKV